MAPPPGFSNTAGLNLLAMLQPGQTAPAPPTMMPQHAPPPGAHPHFYAQQQPAPMPNAGMYPGGFHLPQAPPQAPPQPNAAGMQLMAMLGIGGAPPATAPEEDEDAGEEILFRGKQHSPRSAPAAAAAAPSKAAQPSTGGPTTACLKSRAAPAPAAAAVPEFLAGSSTRRPQRRTSSTAAVGPGAKRREPKMPDGTIGFHEGRAAAGLPVVYVANPDARPGAPASHPHTHQQPHHNNNNAYRSHAQAPHAHHHHHPTHQKKGAHSALVLPPHANPHAAPAHHSHHHKAGGAAHRSPLKNCGNEPAHRGNAPSWRTHLAVTT